MDARLLAMDFGVALACVTASAILYLLTPSNRHPMPASGYILYNRVTHSRLLPKPSSHSFTYPTFSLLLSLNALETRSLDLCRGWLFGYGGIHLRVTGLRPAGYLFQDQNRVQSFKEKLVQILEDRGLNGSLLADAWMQTMPSLCGWEGINPLTVYYCYQKEGGLWLVVLEVHNTFGERHVYVLEVGDNEDKVSANEVDHQWTFRRSFHVSPFNDRNGFYTVSVASPSHRPPPLASGWPSEMPVIIAPRPAVRIHYHLASADAPDLAGPLKLLAVFNPVSSEPFTSHAVLKTLLKYPFTLFLTMPRILKEAWVLHYRRKLDVWVRPEPLPAVHDWRGDSSSGMSQVGLGGGVGWQDEGVLERFARRKIEEFLEKRVAKIDASVKLVSANPMFPVKMFPSFGSKDVKQSTQRPNCDNCDVRKEEHIKTDLTIYYLSPRFFTVVLLSPSARHALLLGRQAEKLFEVTDDTAFLKLFDSASPSSDATQAKFSLAQWIRSLPIPVPIRSHLAYHIPPAHPVDASLDYGVLRVTTVLVLGALLFLEQLERFVFTSVGTRFVAGQEPWKGWERAQRALLMD